MGSVPSVDGRMPFTEPMRSVGSPLRRRFHEHCAGASNMSAMSAPLDAADEMVCESYIPQPMVNGITMTQENNVENHSSSARGDEGGVSHLQTLCKNEFLKKYGILQTDFAEYASFLLNFCAGGHPSGYTTPDNVKISLTTSVQFLQQRIEKITHAAILELTLSKEAHEAEMAKLRINFDEEMNEIKPIPKEEMQELNICQLEDLTERHAPQCHLKDMNTFQWLGWQKGKRKVQMLHVQLDEKKIKTPKTNLSQNVQNGDLIAKKIEYLEKELRHSQEANKSSDQEVQHLKSSNEEKEKIVKELMSETSQLKVKLAEIEIKAAKESVTSGSYADYHANPGMLEDACTSVDKAIDILSRALHEVSITSNTSAKQKDRVEHFLREISFATLDNFSRQIQLKYAWGHWICSRMFDDFEHVFFDVHEGMVTSPLDPKKHTEKCFQGYRQKKHIPSLELYKGCDMFRAFCIVKYSSVFEPFDLTDIEKILYPCRVYGGEEIWRLFLDVAKAVWLLHELSFSFDPPATILRMGFEFPYDMQYHESVIHDADDSGKTQDVLLMIRPAFRLRNSIVRSRVFLKTSRH